MRRPHHVTYSVLRTLYPVLRTVHSVLPGPSLPAAIAFHAKFTEASRITGSSGSGCKDGDGFSAI